MKMHSIHTWAEFWELLRSWWAGDVPAGGVAMAIVITVLRVAYTGGGWKKMLLEAPLCGLVTLSVYSSLNYFGLPTELAVGIGGSIGLIGVEQIRNLAIRVINFRFGGGNPQA
ncbi:MAG: phage holin, lambda family [Pantoea sp.]|uniref:phage holin, lambda family n=1 Tax=Pantoea sp. TaxID=69393 RepID=UPI002396E9BE|nr:phage holin, lambda family [Pantoea sp.]MDE1188215.1 phage holin, lambda family [Pantoea sp.]